MVVIAAGEDFVGFDYRLNDDNGAAVFEVFLYPEFRVAGFRCLLRFMSVFAFFYGFLGGGGDHVVCDVLIYVAAVGV